MKKTKVLHIITHLPIGGAQDNTLITIEYLDRTRYDVHLLCNRSGEWVSRAESINDIKIHYIKELVREINPFCDVIALLKIIHVIRKNRYHIVHTHSSKPGFVGRLAAKLAGVSVIIHTVHGFPFHDYMFPPVRWCFIQLERLLSKWSNKLITVSTLNMRKAIYLNIAPRTKFINIYSGIRFSKFNQVKNKVKTRRTLDIPLDAYVIGFVGRLSKQKSPQYLIHAIPDVLKEKPNVHVLLIGYGELREKLIRITQKLDLTKYIHFLGYRDDIPDLLSSMDVFVLSSLWEGLGRSLTEAMISGVPVVATAVEGVPELVMNNKTGILIPPKDSRAMAEGINYIITHKDQAERMASNAKKHVLKLFSAKTMIKQIDLLYRELVEQT